MTHRMKSTSKLQLSIVGLGPRGLILMERIVAFSRRHPELSIELAILEPNQPGTGSHSTAQPDYLKLNTVACQLSMFPGRLTDMDDVGHFGPSLFDWCRSRGEAVADDHSPCSSSRRPVRPVNFLPRRLLGEYLFWFYSYLTGIAPMNLKVSLHRTKAVDARWLAEANAFEVLAENGTRVLAERVFITIGHVTPPAKNTLARPSQATDQAYPLPDTLTSIHSEQNVAIHGLGLTAMDVMVALIKEWGGSFVEDDAGRLSYQGSGREGKLVFLSRSGLPYCARPDTSAARIKYEATFMTAEAIDALRGQAGIGGLDFQAVILPLMRLEMIVAYYACCSAQDRDKRRMLKPNDVGPVVSEARRQGKLQSILDRLASKWGAFNPETYLALELPAGLLGDGYRLWLIDRMRSDLIACKRGLAASPLKSALEVWRDLRDGLRAVIDGQALTWASRCAFFRDYAPMINRLVAGPEPQRIAELLCLMGEGVAEVTVGCPARLHGLDRSGGISIAREQPGPGRRNAFDHTIRAYLPMSGTTREDTPLLKNLVRRGVISRLLPDAAMDAVAVTPCGKAIAPNGIINGNIWVFGPAVEGATYYNHYVPSPDGPSRAYLDAHRAVKACFDSVSAQMRPQKGQGGQALEAAG